MDINGEYNRPWQFSKIHVTNPPELYNSLLLNKTSRSTGLRATHYERRAVNVSISLRIKARSSPDRLTVLHHVKMSISMAWRSTGKEI